MTTSTDQSARRYRFSRRLRLTRALDFEAVRAANRRRYEGPLVIYARPNGRSHPRLGLRVSRRVGNAVVRHRIKRRLREAFRLWQHDLPAGYDLLISVRPHEPLTLAEYQRLLSRAARKLHDTWTRTSPPTTPPADPTNG